MFTDRRKTMKKLITFDWNTFSAETTEQKLSNLLADQRSRISKRLETGSPFTWANFCQFMEELANERHLVWSPIVHMLGVAKSRVPDEVFGRCQQIVSEFETEVSQDARLFNAYKEVSSDQNLTEEQQSAVTLILKKFKLSGVDLPDQQKKRFGEIVVEMEALKTAFNNHVTDSLHQWHITDVLKLDGLPESTIAIARQEAREHGLNGYLLILSRASYFCVMENAKNRELRYSFFREWNTRASEKDGGLDNTPLMEKILALRAEMVQMLGLKNFAELSTQTKMAESTDEVMNFLNTISLYSRKATNHEYNELSRFAKEHDNVEKLEPWDVVYYGAKMKEENLSFSEQKWREYFPLSKVLEGLFEITRRMYGVSFKENKTASVWHPDVRFFEIYVQNDELAGGIYMDFFGRNKEKQGGAWMDTAVVRCELADGTIQLPVGYLCCNFEPPAPGKESLLTSEEAETLFHEFGHNLHHVLTQCNVFSVSGPNVEWDGVELPSQFMENFCWEKESIRLMSAHYLTGEPTPDELIDKKLATRKFGQGFANTRLFVLAPFDFLLHMEDPKVDIAAFYKKSAEDREPFEIPYWSRFANSFTHIFASDAYAAGYYSYQWARVLDADAFEAFKRADGGVNWTLGQKFLDELISRGGSRPLMESYVSFRGHKPTADALLKRYGFIE